MLDWHFPQSPQLPPTVQPHWQELGHSLLHQHSVLQPSHSQLQYFQLNYEQLQLQNLYFINKWSLKLQSVETGHILWIVPVMLHIPAWMPPAVNPRFDRIGAVARPGAARTTAPEVPATTQVVRSGFWVPQEAAYHILATVIRALQYIGVYQPELSSLRTFQGQACRRLRQSFRHPTPLAWF